MRKSRTALEAASTEKNGKNFFELEGWKKRKSKKLGSETTPYINQEKETQRVNLGTSVSFCQK